MSLTQHAGELVARRKKTSPIEDLIEVIALLPWWAAVALGIVGYFVLHAFAQPPLVASAKPADMMSQAIWKGLATGGQYLVPIACFFAAILSAVGRHQRKELVSNVAAGKAPDVLDGMSWQQFEMLVGEAFRLQGYRVVEMGGSGPDGGIDLTLHKDREKFLVQCKQWKAFKVGVQVVRELYGVMAAKGAAGGFVVTSGRFTEEATAFASGRNVTLVDGSKLFGMIQMARASVAGAASANASRRAPEAAVQASPHPPPMEPARPATVTA
ncbi:MAG TPA: restriction endonuclease, partial [Burkholderiaceae bacterium]|nr:restriction endonuclease [Burkholderiaceae bacterium]